jgi:hypothetical protein
MRARGYAEGQTLAFDHVPPRTISNSFRTAGELVSSKVDVIVASRPAILAARQATDTIPDRHGVLGKGDLIESGIIASVARPVAT